MIAAITHLSALALWLLCAAIGFLILARTWPK